MAEKPRPQAPIQERRKPGRFQKGKDDAKKGSADFSPATPARVEEVICRVGTTGEAIQVRCKVLEGHDRNKVLRRNVKGPIQIGDILMLRETEFEAHSLNAKGRGTGA